MNGANLLPLNLLNYFQTVKKCKIDNKNEDFLKQK